MFCKPVYIYRIKWCRSSIKFHNLNTQNVNYKFYSRAINILFRMLINIIVMISNAPNKEWLACRAVKGHDLPWHRCEFVYMAQTKTKFIVHSEQKRCFHSTIAAQLTAVCLLAGPYRGQVNFSFRRVFGKIF